ncbi:hypothetical protein FZEAL_2895 [Fusarium zealandicum]|uniref:DUF3669 domain-containing protein n=1 Tax=Fusarium zealandicum TaxID=1053134 RepID=A0A8H4UQI5_9HYPO|nr:hypothetical protein FZEAL_2895 [Fusarium zealandicum]
MKAVHGFSESKYTPTLGQPSAEEPISEIVADSPDTTSIKHTLQPLTRGPLSVALGEALSFNDVSSRSPTTPGFFNIRRGHLAAKCHARESLVNTSISARNLVFPDKYGLTVLKLSRGNDEGASLAETSTHVLIEKKIKHYGCNVRVPQYYGIVGREDYKSWIPESITSTEDMLSLPSGGNCMERIPPLSDHARDLLVERFCPRQFRQAAREDPVNEQCLARIYLGSQNRTAHERTTTKEVRAFTLHNFILHYSDMVELGMDMQGLARNMGTALAVMHWGALTDARGVEFVLGSTADRENPLWLLDFDRVRPITKDMAGVSKAYEAYESIARYFPRADTGDYQSNLTFCAFGNGYMDMSRVILDKEPYYVQILPERFMELLIRGS